MSEVPAAPASVSGEAHQIAPLARSWLWWISRGRQVWRNRHRSRCCCYCCCSCPRCCRRRGCLPHRRRTGTSVWRTRTGTTLGVLGAVPRRTWSLLLSRSDALQPELISPDFGRHVTVAFVQVLSIMFLVECCVVSDFLPNRPGRSIERIIDALFD
jgi:hypothetical protein